MQYDSKQTCYYGLPDGQVEDANGNATQQYQQQDRSNDGKRLSAQA